MKFRFPIFIIDEDYRSENASGLGIRALSSAIEAEGGPSELFNCVAQPTIESAQTLMKHPDVRLLVVTGGGGVVKAAMNSGKRAIAAGPGKLTDSGERGALSVKKGDTVLYGKYAGSEVDIDGVEHKIMRESEKPGVSDTLKPPYPYSSVG